MSGARGSWRVAVGVLAGLAAGGAQANDRPAGCRFPAAGSARVAAAVDARTILLADGREVRLAAIEVPDREEAGATEAKAALHTLLAGREVILRPVGEGTDRYGRVPALVQASPTGTSAQLALLAGGHARVSARVGDAGCAAELLAAERAARAAGLGLWKHPYYAVRQAEDASGILAERGRFTLVEGKVISVRQSGGTIYVNFGRRWSEDFTVTVLRRNERVFAGSGFELRKLGARHVRIRGIVEERGGPWIEAVRPEQIELAERD
jgi:endonuclease YncB( thermonuclease family)